MSELQASWSFMIAFNFTASVVNGYYAIYAQRWQGMHFAFAIASAGVGLMLLMKFP